MIAQRLGFIALAAALAAPGALADPATTVRAVELRERPAADAPAVASLAANASVDLVRREGAWVQLRSGTGTGWAKLFDVRLAPAAGAAPRGSGDALSQTLGLATGARAPSVTTGVRGLDADMLSRAQPDARQFATLESYAVTKDRAQAFAREGSLTARSVEPLAPRRAAAPANLPAENPR